MTAGTFEFLILESAQADLSWRTILRKRAGYRRAFAGFDAGRVARFNRRSVERLVADPGIVRNRSKIEAAIGNARHYLAIQEEFGSFTDYAWRFVGGEPIVNRWRAQSEVPATSAESDLLSRDLKARGFKFVGLTVGFAVGAPLLVLAQGQMESEPTESRRVSCRTRPEGSGARET